MPVNECHQTHPDDRTYCTDCTGQPFVPYVPPHFDQITVTGWDSGANSIRVRSGDCYAQFQLGAAGAIVCGLAAAPRAEVTDMTNVLHGFYAIAATGSNMILSVIESGAMYASDSAAVDAVLRIERRRGVVRYLVGGVERYVSQRLSTGPVLVGACLFRSGDTVF
jgi:hypothetical protein